MTQDSELHRAVGRIEGQLATMTDMLKAALKTGNDRNEGAEKRLRAVERKQAVYSGAAAAVGALVAFFVKH
jgi:hypothetical protein